MWIRLFYTSMYIFFPISARIQKNGQRLAVVWLEEFDKLRVTYDATDAECLNIHFYKNLSSEEFEYALQEYREYEKGIKNKDDSLFEMESQAQ